MLLYIKGDGLLHYLGVSGQVRKWIHGSAGVKMFGYYHGKLDSCLMQF
jgi:hypothetical protein